MPLRPFLELVRFSHTLFALPFALLSAVMAAELSSTPIPLRFWIGLLLAMVTGRTAAMGFNRIADRVIDAANPRTAMRHLPAGTIRLRSAVALTALAAVAFIASTLLFLPQNRLPLLLSVPVLAFLFGYSYSKRFTWLAHFWLGAALALAPVSAWVALRGAQVIANPSDLIPAVLLGLGVLFWVAGFDVIYACQDAAFDARSGSQSIPGRFGVRQALRLAKWSHLIAVLFFAAVPLVYPQLGWIYLSGVALIGLLLCYEHAIVRADDLQRVNQAFFHVNAVISVGLLGVGLVDLLLLAKGAAGG